MLRKLLFTTIVLTSSIGCLSKPNLPPSGTQTNPEDLKPGAIGSALEAALNSILTSPEISASAPCPLQILEALAEIQSFECGAMQVPQFHKNDNTSEKNWALAYLKVFKDRTQKKPLLVIEQGGPGGSSMALAAHYLSQMPELLDDFDVLAVEQRGTRWTRPVAFCDEIIEYNLKTLSQPEDEEAESQIHAKCLAEASERINLDSISTYQIAYDLVFSAQHFGYPTFSFFGVSYGTLVGHYLLKFHPDSLEKTILDSPVIPGKDWKKDAVFGFDNLVEKNLSDYILTQTDDRKTVEQVMEDFGQLAKSYDMRPLQITYTYDGKTYPLIFDGYHFIEIFIQLVLVDYIPEYLSYLKQAVETRMTRPAQSNEMIAAFAQTFIDVDRGNTSIMYESLICREFKAEEWQETPHLKLWEILIGEEISEKTAAEREAECRFGFSQRNDSTVIRAPIATDKSVLVVGGENDHVTIPAYVPIVARNFTRGHQAIFKGVGHGVFAEKDCVNKSLLGYLKDPEDRFTNYCEYTAPDL